MHPALETVPPHLRNLIPPDIVLIKNRAMLEKQIGFLRMLVWAEMKRRESFVLSFIASGAFVNELATAQTERDPKSWRIL